VKGMQAPLSDREEAALRQVGFGTDDALEAAHAKRLLHLDLIESGGCRWRRLTSIDFQRSMPSSVIHRPAPPANGRGVQTRHPLRSAARTPIGATVL
jgi:hypothetical protein